MRRIIDRVGYVTRPQTRLDVSENGRQSSTDEIYSQRVFRLLTHLVYAVSFHQSLGEDVDMIKSFAFGIASLTVLVAFFAGNSSSHADGIRKDECIELGARTDGPGTTGVHVLNKCQYRVTFVALSDGGLDYLILNPIGDSGSDLNWTTAPFSRWRACFGYAHTDC
jgi:hypothetical protein